MKPGAANRGSVLILVLWVLMLVGVLAGLYLGHNRDKAAMAAYGWEALAREQACKSLQELFRGARPPGLSPPGRRWLALKIGDRSVWVRFGSESGRLSLNAVTEEKLRAYCRAALGEERREQADIITDSLLDWRDGNQLVRANGAEEDYYTAEGLPYGPADGPFKLLAAMLRVRGVTPELFWGTMPVAAAVVAPSRLEEEDTLPEDEQEEKVPDRLPLVNAFTTRGKSVKRLEVIFPLPGGGGEEFIFLLQPAGRQWRRLTMLHTFLPPPAAE